MATTSDLLTDTLSRVRENVHAVLASTPQDRLADPPAEGANTVAWLVWHITRGLDEQCAEVFGYPAVWEAAGWRERMALPLPADAHGYGMTFDEVLRVRASTEHLRGYFDDASAAADRALSKVYDGDLDRVVDANCDPPVTLAVRLVSVLDDCTQHVGQAAYASGILAR